MIRHYFNVQLQVMLIILLMVSGCASTPKTQKQAINTEIAGMWISDESTQKIYIYFVDESIKVESWDRKDKEPFEVSNIRWNGEELKATFVMPSSAHATHSTFTQISPDKLRESYEGNAKGTMIWKRE